MRVASKSDEPHLLSSLCTLCYIEFDNLCNLDYLEERNFVHADLPWSSKHSYHVIGKYNNIGQYMVHRVYICTNLNSPFGVHDCDGLVGNHHTNIFTCFSSIFVSQKWNNCWCLPMVFGAKFLCNQPAFPIMYFVGTNLLQDRNDKVS
jgi:hypothetical protein